MLSNVTPSGSVRSLCPVLVEKTYLSRSLVDDEDPATTDPASPPDLVKHVLRGTLLQTDLK